MTCGVGAGAVTSTSIVTRDPFPVLGTWWAEGPASARLCSHALGLAELTCGTPGIPVLLPARTARGPVRGRRVAVRRGDRVGRPVGTVFPATSARRFSSWQRTWFTGARPSSSTRCARTTSTCCRPTPACVCESRRPPAPRPARPAPAPGRDPRAPGGGSGALALTWGLGGAVVQGKQLASVLIAPMPVHPPCCTPCRPPRAPGEGAGACTERRSAELPDASPLSPGSPRWPSTSPASSHLTTCRRSSPSSPCPFPCRN